MRNQVKLALRHLWKEKGFTIINSIGLSTGIAAALAVLLYSVYHYSFDRFHDNPEQIFRVLTIDRALGVSSSSVGVTTPGAGPAAKREIVQVQDQVRFMEQGTNLLRHGDQAIFAQNFAFVDSSFFSFFNFPLKSGNPTAVLRKPNSVLISESLSRKIFGNSDPVGQSLEAAHSDEPVLIEGVFRDIPSNSHLQFDMVASAIPSENDSNTRQFLESWQIIAAPTYIRLDDPESADRVLEELKTIGRRNDYGENDNFDLTLQPLLSTHMHSTEMLFDNHNKGKIDFSQIQNLLTVAVFLLLIAAFNFMNLSTARSGKRAKEIGLRKVLGARRLDLIGQFLLESILLTLLGLGMALILLEVFGPKIGISVPEGFISYFFQHPKYSIWSIVFVLIIGVLSGLYPAFVLSAHQPIATLRGNFNATGTGTWLRRVLVTVQFAASIAVIAGMIIVRSQVKFMDEKDMGFDKEHVITLQINSLEAYENASLLRDEVLKIEEVKGATFANSLPGMGFGRTSIQPEGYTGEENWIFSVANASFDFDSVMGIQISKGRFFDRNHPSDIQNGVVINQAAVDAIGWDDPIGKHITLGGSERTVIGVIKNFHYVGLRYPIEPLLVLPLPNAGGILTVKIDGSNSKLAIANIEKKWRQINPSDPFDYRFFDDQFNEMFVEDQQFAHVLTSLNGLAILIACLGLLGLTAYTLQLKFKELGIRKILGAKLLNVAWILSREFWFLLLAANLIALPISYLYMRQWLDEFVYRIDMDIWPFVIASMASFLLAFTTVIIQAIRAEKIDPIKALKHN